MSTAEHLLPLLFASLAYYKYKYVTIRKGFEPRWDITWQRWICRHTVTFDMAILPTYSFVWSIFIDRRPRADKHLPVC